MSEIRYCKNCRHRESEHFAPDGSPMLCTGEKTINRKMHDPVRSETCKCPQFVPKGPAVTVRYLGFAESQIEELLEKIFERCPESWSVQMIGDSQNTIWRLKVSDSEGQVLWDQMFYGEDGGHDAAKIKSEARNFLVAYFRARLTEQEQEADGLRSIGGSRKAQALESSVAERKATLAEYEKL